MGPAPGTRFAICLGGRWDMQVGLEIAVAMVGCVVAALAGWVALQTVFVLTFGRGK